jgi:hypothetical protein
MPLEGIPAAGRERADAARANRQRDVSERCLDPVLGDVVDRRKLRRRKLARHDIIDDGKRFGGSSTLPVLIISRFVMASLTLAAQSVGIASAN